MVQFHMIWFFVIDIGEKEKDKFHIEKIILLIRVYKDDTLLVLQVDSVMS